MLKKSHHFLTLWPWPLTYDLEKLIRSGHYHYQCVYQIWEQSIPWFLSYRVNTIAGGGRLRRKTITSPDPSDTGDIIMDANSSYPDGLPNNFQCGKYSIASGKWFYKIITNCYFPVCSISINRITFHETCFVSNHKCNGSECCCKNIFHVVIVCVNFPWMINPGRLLSISHYFLFHCTNLFAFPYFLIFF